MRTAASVLLALAGALATALSANAALFFQFSQASARPGATVTASEPGWPSIAHGVTVYLVLTRLPGVRPDSAGGYILRRPPKHKAILLGQPQLTADHRLTISFRVPDVEAGDYTTAFWCRTCMKGGDFFTSARWGATWTGRPGPVLRVDQP
jgi:hypothetical protein